MADYYHERLQHNQAALDYLATRGLDDEQLVKRFRIGFCDRTLGLRIPHKNRKLGAELRTRLAELGVYRKKSGHEHMRGRIIVPVTDASGTVRQFYGRRIDERPPKNTRHLYLPRPMAGIVNARELRQMPARAPGPEIILCESIIDALTFLRHGMEAVTCTFGNEGFTDELFQAIEEAKIESVRFAYDADDAGERAVKRDTERLQKIGIECWSIKFPWGSDANGLAVEKGADALRHAVRSADWLGTEGATVRVAADSSSLAAKVAEVPEEAAKKEVMVEVPKPSTPELKRKGDYYELQLGECGPHGRMYRVGGLEKNHSLEVLKITLRMMEPSGLFHVDSLDLYRDGERRKFIERAAEETNLERELIKRDLGKLLLALEGLQEERLVAPLEPAEASVQLTPEEQSEALALLRSPDLLAKLTEAFADAGIVGEETNVLAAYLACASRKLAKPLA